MLRPAKKLKQGNKIPVRYWPIEREGDCWVCKKRGSRKWNNKWWCWRHSPTPSRYFRRSYRQTRSVQYRPDPAGQQLGNPMMGTFSSQGTSKLAEEKMQREIDAKLGRKKRKPAKPKKKPRDRRYVR